MSEEQVNQIREIFYEMRREFPWPTELTQVDDATVLLMKEDENTKRLEKWFETYLGVFHVGVPGKLGEALGIHFNGGQEDA